MKQQNVRFAALHCHTHYSFLDSINKPEKVMARAAELEYDAVAITDHGNMCGVVACYKAAQKVGMKFIPGLEAYFTNDLVEDENQRKRFHLTLLAINEAGYKNLCRLSTLSFTEGFYYKPRIDFNLLNQYNEGIVALSGCLSGMIAQSLLQDGDPTDVVGKFVDIFGRDRFFMEIWDHKLPEQRRVVPRLIELAKKEDIKLVATQDCHYTDASHHMTHAHLLAIGRRTSPREAQYPTEHFYMKSKEQMRMLFQHVPEAVTNTALVADMVDWDLDLETKHAPKYQAEGVVDNVAEFRKQVMAGFDDRYPKGTRPKGSIERLKHEVRVIEKLGFTDYFLILADLCDHAREVGIPTGPGRGSAAGSIVSYCLRITDIDPLKYGLLFERFLNEDRVSDPDIDMDFCKARRQEVIHYLEDRYGKENVSKIGTFSKLHAKSALRDIGRARGLFFKHQDEIAKKVPDGDPDWDVRELLKNPPDVAREITGFEEYIQVTSELMGTIRHQGIHAAGVLVGDRPLIDLIPLYTTAQDKKTKISQFDMNDVEAVGLLKIDVLGLETLTVIERCLQSISEDKRPVLNSENVEDEEAFKLMRSGRTVGLFQLESFGMRQILLRSQPKEIEDIIATIALYRPGPLDCLGGSVPILTARCDAGNRKNYHYKTVEDLFSLVSNKTPVQLAQNPYYVRSVNLDTGNLVKNKIVGVYATGKKEIFNLDIDVYLSKGIRNITFGKRKTSAIRASAGHKFFTLNGWKKVEDLIPGDYVAILRREFGVQRATKNVPGAKNFQNIAFTHYQYRCVFCDWDEGALDVNHLEGNRYTNNSYENLCFLCPNHHRMYTEGTISKEEVIAQRKDYELPVNDNIIYARFNGLESLGVEETYEIEVKEPHRNYVAADFIVHNSGMVEHYVNRKRGEEEVVWLHPTLSEILAPTYGVLVYQEQIMQSVVKLCGYTMAEADELRRVIGKKKLDLLPVEKKKFIHHFMKHTGGSEDEAEVIWAQIETFGRYGFNKPHAASYAVISYWTAYLKAHFPLEFMASVLTSEVGNKEKLQKYVFECTQRLKIPVLPPDINVSEVGFIPEGECIRAGLSTIEGLAENSANSIVSVRGDEPFKSISDLLSRVRRSGKKMNVKVATNLAASGALDGIIPNRASAVKGVPDLLTQERPDIVSLFEDEEISDLVEVEEFPKLERRERQEQTLGMHILKVGNR